MIVAEITSTQVWQTLFSGVAVGTKYALIALGFVIIFKATGVINFAQGGFVLLGGYFCFNAADTWGWGFWWSVLFAMVGGAAIAITVEALILRRMIGEQPFTLIMVTIGLLFVIDNTVTAVWGPDNRNLGDPWGIETRQIGDVILAEKDIAAIVMTAIVLAGFFLFFRYTVLGLAMRATADDQEAALAQGISARRVYRVSWAIAGVVGALAGVMLSTGSGQLYPGVGLVALAAFPAMVLGGMTSPLGAVIGGLIIGLVQQFTALLAPEYAPWLGDSFEVVSPYLVMIVILLVRPYGLFGTPEIRRV